MSVYSNYMSTRPRMLMHTNLKVGGDNLREQYTLYLWVHVWWLAPLSWARRQLQTLHCLVSVLWRSLSIDPTQESQMTWSVLSWWSPGTWHRGQLCSTKVWASHLQGVWLVSWESETMGGTQIVLLGAAEKAICYGLQATIDNGCIAEKSW